MHKVRYWRHQLRRVLFPGFYLPLLGMLLVVLLLLIQGSIRHSIDLWSIVFPSTQATQPNLPAFPGAEGFGAIAVGGRGGRVIEVTNLNDRGLGSLRAAIEAPEPRTIVFRVSGTIVLDSSLEIRNPYITIAGQTAPGDGITLRNSPSNGRTPLQIKTHDVIVRYLRSRPGSSPNDSGNLDALTIADSKGQVYNVIVDHCSFSWATDEVVSTFYDAHDITIQWSIISEGSDCSTHVEQAQQQCHSMGLLLGSKGSHNISIHHNLFAHNRRRNPLVKNVGITDVVNNVVYNAGFGADSFSPTQVMGTYGTAQVNYVGNYFRPGINTGSANWFIDTKAEPVQVYAADNQVPRSLIHDKSRRWLVHRRHAAPAITTTSAETAYEQVLTQAGATFGLSPRGGFIPQRDEIDARIVSEVIQRRGRIINDPAEVGGWATLKMDTSVSDRDRDGMPDVFEIRNRLNPEDATDGAADADGDGYTNLEEYLNGTSLINQWNVNRSK